MILRNLWLLLVAAPTLAQEPRLTPMATGSQAEFRGLHVLDDGRTLWASGSGGRFATSADGGATWRADSVPGAGGLFFVDVHAFDARSAVLAGTSFAGGEARIYRTEDGGRTWQQTFALRHPAVFLDGLVFWDGRRGVAFGDPVDGAFFVLRTEDGGRSWTRIPAGALPAPLAGEAAFAASGTSIAAGPDGRAWFATGGGPRARVFRTTDFGRTWHAATTPFEAGSSAGIFGLAFADAHAGIAVAGDHQQPEQDRPNVLRTRDRGETWELAGSTVPPGVKYGVAVHGAQVLAPSPRGTAWSADEGRTWSMLTDASYNTAAFAPDGTAWLAGVKGGIAKVELPRVPPRPAR